MHVLVVESDPALWRALELALALRGHVLTVVTDREPALERARQEPYPLVIVGQAGEHAPAALCRDLRQEPGTQRSTILVLAARDAPEAIVDALDAGADGYLARPIVAGQLREKLELIEQPARALPVVDHPHDLRHRALVEHDDDLVLITDGGGTVVWAAPPVERILGQRPAAVVQRSVYTLCHPDDAPAVMRLLTDALAGEECGSVDLRLAHADGSWRVMEVRAVNLLDDPRIGGILLTAHDVTERAARQHELQRHALHDPLTGLPTRSLFLMYLERALARAERQGTPVGIMYVDVDDLAAVNTAQGAEAGDEVLAEVGRRLRLQLRATDTAARMGDDELAILLEDLVSEHEAAVIADRLVRQLQAPLAFRGAELPVSVSIGVVFSAPGAPVAPGVSQAGELLRRADVALYRAKAAGKGRWVLADARLAGIDNGGTTTSARLPSRPAAGRRRGSLVTPDDESRD